VQTPTGVEYPATATSSAAARVSSSTRWAMRAGHSLVLLVNLLDAWEEVAVSGSRPNATSGPRHDLQAIRSENEGSVPSLMIRARAELRQFQQGRHAVRGYRSPRRVALQRRQAV